MSQQEPPPRVYIIHSAEDPSILLSIETASQPIDFKHVPVVTDYPSTKWIVDIESSSNSSIQLFEQPDAYVVTEDGKGGVFVSQKKNFTNSSYVISAVNQQQYQQPAYKIQIPGGGFFTSNGSMNQVTIKESNDGVEQLWYFQLVTPGKYECYGNFFEQDTLNANENGIDCVYPRFGLKLPFTWGWFWKHIKDLNNTSYTSSDSVAYKVFFLARHGKAANNARPNDALDMWDAALVQDGYVEANQVRSIWISELAAGIGLPQISYSSPLTRALATNTITFGDLPVNPPLVTTVVEECREKYSDEQPEHRHSQKYIQQMFPAVLFDNNFDPSGEDPFWPRKESHHELDQRVKDFMGKIFDPKHKDATFVSITTHSGWIDAFCRVLGRAPYKTSYAVVLPIVVKYTSK